MEKRLPKGFIVNLKTGKNVRKDTEKTIPYKIPSDVMKGKRKLVLDVK